MARFLVRKIQAEGGPDLSHLTDRLEAKIHEKLLADEDALSIFIDDGEAGTREISLDVAEADLDEFSQQLEDELSAKADELIDGICERFERSVRKQAARAVADRARSTNAFEQRLGIRWKKPLDLLALQIGLATQFGQETNEWLRVHSDGSNGATIEALTRLHARGMQVAHEIEVLLRTGFADGALSRWRTLHEITIVGLFVQQYGNETATRYLDHIDIDSLRMARMYRAASEKLGYDPMSEDEWDELQAKGEALCAHYGAEFRTEYGWAVRALNNRNPSFADLERAVELEKLRPYYKLASDNVHAGPKGAFWRLGLLTGARDVLLSGPSNAGLEEGGRLAAFSVSQLSTLLLQIEPTVDGIAWGRVLNRLSGEIEQAFLAAKAKLIEDENKMRDKNTVRRRPRKRPLTPKQRSV